MAQTIGAEGVMEGGGRSRERGEAGCSGRSDRYEAAGSGTSIDCRGKALDGGRRRGGGGPRRATATRSPQARNEEEKGGEGEGEEEEEGPSASSVCLLWLEDRGRREGGQWRERSERPEGEGQRRRAGVHREGQHTAERDRQIEEPPDRTEAARQKD